MNNNTKRQFIPHITNEALQLHAGLDRFLHETIVKEAQKRAVAAKSDITGGIMSDTIRYVLETIAEDRNLDWAA